MRRPLSQAHVAAVVATTVGVWLAQAAHAAPDRYGPPAPADASDAAQPAPQAQPTTYIYSPGKPTAAAPAAPAPAAWAPPAAAVARPTRLYAPPRPRPRRRRPRQAPMRRCRRASIRSSVSMARPRALSFRHNSSPTPARRISPRLRRRPLRPCWPDRRPPARRPPRSVSGRPTKRHRTTQPQAPRNDRTQQAPRPDRARPGAFQ